MKLKRILESILFLVFFILLAGIIYYLTSYKDTYNKALVEMVKQAKEMVSKNNIKVENQKYIFLDELSVDNTELCMRSSGVIVTNVENELKYTPYLKCTDYESKILNNDETYIKLDGDSIIIIPVGSLYLDSGYTKIKDVDVTTIGDVIDEAGAYTLNYVVKENGYQVQIVKRIVIVTDRDTSLIEPNNEEEPMIVLNGEENIVLALNTEYKEPGFVAQDSKDGNLTSKVKVEGKVNPKVIGTYKIKYTVQNSHGKSTTVTRNVKVVKKLANLNITADLSTLSSEVVIKITTFGDGFNKVILPNNKESLSTINEYKVSKNGKYTFKIIDTYKNEIEKTVIVNSIDNEPPTGKCVASKKETEYDVNVKAEDNNGVKGVIYIINGNESGLFNSYQYKTIEVIDKVEVIIVDLADNKTKISCKIND